MSVKVWDEITDEPLASYIVRHRDASVLMSSTSGGAFSALAEAVIAKGGVVFGAKYQDGVVVHSYTNSLEGLAAFRGSKYAQSKIGQSYRDVKSFIEAGKPVLFSGTPCQISALLGFLKLQLTDLSALSLLFTMDFVCHGVGSPKALASYLSDKKMHGFDVESINMRSKHYGYRSSSMELRDLHGGVERISGNTDEFLKAFYSNYILRPSCHECRFKGVKRDSDLTVWDCWVIDSGLNIRDDNKGFGKLIVHTEKGIELLGAADDSLDIYQVEFSSIRPARGGMMLFSSQPNSEREQFMLVLEDQGLSAAIREFAPKTSADEAREAAKLFLGRVGVLDSLLRMKKAWGSRR